MSHPEALGEAYRALDACEVDLGKLDASCCDSGRSPRMAALAKTLAEVRKHLEDAPVTQSAGVLALLFLEDAGAQIGGL